MHYLAKTSLIARRFSADFSDITLTQHGNSDPLVINGVGTISQDDLGRLSLKVFQQNALDGGKVRQYQNEKSGGKVSSAGGCSLQATEYGGATWTCNYLKTQDFLLFGSDSFTGVFSAHVSSLTNSTGIPSCFQKSWFEGIIPFELDLPFNLCAEGKRNSYPERMLKFVYNKVTKVEILRCNGYTSIKISNKFELISERFIEVFTQALSIATGRSVQYIWRLIGSEHFYHKMISEFDFDLSRNSLNPPLNLRYGMHLLEFLEKYINYSLRNEHNYFGYWEKLHASWASGLAVAALPLSVYIEGVMKEFYPELMRPDASTVEEDNLVIDAIRNLTGVEDKVKERAYNRVRSPANGTVVKGLRALAQQGCIDANLVSRWQYVRNRSAHGNDFTQEQVQAKIQEIVSGIFSCLYLFYQLLYLKLEFSGHIVNYSQIGFPEEFRYADRFKLKKKQIGK